MANYFISGVWKNNQNDITHIYIHDDLPNNVFGFGRKITVTQGINLLNNGNTLQMLDWNYTTATWQAKDFVTVVNAANPYLRSHKNNVINDNLDNALNYQAIVF